MGSVFGITPSATFVSRFVRSTKIEWLLPFLSIVGVCGWTDITRNGPNADKSSVLNATLEIALLEVVLSSRVVAG